MYSLVILLIKLCQKVDSHQTSQITLVLQPLVILNTLALHSLKCVRVIMKNDIVHSIVEIPGFGVIWSDFTSIFVFRKWY